jgi:hypothetical protein
MLMLHHLIGHKAWLSAVSVILVPSKWIGRLTNSIKSFIPEGYEDETGFHFSPKSDSK